MAGRGSQDTASLEDDVDSVSKKVLRSSRDQELDQGSEKAVHSERESLRKEETEPEGLRVLAEDLVWGIVEEKGTDIRDESKLEDRLKFVEETRRSSKWETRPSSKGETRPSSKGETRPSSKGETRPSSGGETRPSSGGETRPSSGGETRPPSRGETRTSSKWESRRSGKWESRRSSKWEARPSTLADRNVDQAASFEGNQTVNVEAAEETQVETETAEYIVDGQDFQQDLLSEPTQETNVPPDDEDSKLIKPVKSFADHEAQISEAPSQTQAGITVAQPAEDDKDMNIKDLIYVPREIFLDTQEKLRVSTTEDKIKMDLEMKKEDMIIKLQKTLAKNESLRMTSLSLQSKIADYLQKTPVEDKSDLEKGLFTEKTYLSALGELRSLRKTVESNNEFCQMHVNDMKQKCKQKKAEVEVERNKLMALMQNVIQGAIFSHTRKPLPPKDLEDYLNALSNKELEISKIRLGIIKLKNRMEKSKRVLRSKEELADGLRIQDFEQLKIENQTLNEKIEEKNVDMTKLKRKIVSTVQVMSHCKEKLRYVQEDNVVKVNALREVEAALAESREILAKLKSNRDAMKTENAKLREESGFLGNTMLLEDFENQKGQIADASIKLKQMKAKYLMLTQRCNKIQGEIQDVRKKLKAKTKLK